MVSGRGGRGLCLPHSQLNHEEQQADVEANDVDQSKCLQTHASSFLYHWGVPGPSGRKNRKEVFLYLFNRTEGSTGI